MLQRALDQAASGKGAERHALDQRRFEDQRSMTIARHQGVGYPLGQAEKKAGEAVVLLRARGMDAFEREVLGLINYAAIALLAAEAAATPGDGAGGDGAKDGAHG
ncbi:MAG: hypothetical protein HQL35_14835 [Alphaproteobacteria bacterium]|nr:hypothetical protein [Alphaproteobacteria bacterium]